MAKVSATEEMKELSIDNANTDNASNASEQPKQSPAEQRRAAAEQHKTEGNEQFAKQHYQAALDAYTRAIETDDSNAVYYANRAFCHMKLESYGLAIADATRGIELDGKYVKSYYRRGSAHLALSHHRDALVDFKAVVRIKPSDKDAQLRVKECEQAIRAKAFHDAIASQSSIPVSETLDYKTIAVDDSYSGPRLADDALPDQAFITDLITHYKEQKRLHRRYVYQILLTAAKLLKALPTLIEIPAPNADAQDDATVNHSSTAKPLTPVPYNHFTVCGDVHGQYYDLLNIFDMNKLPSPTNPYLFNGDFVDRGSFSLEIIVLFLTSKLVYPHYFHLLRGNHESTNMNNIYGFQGEVQEKVDKGKAMELFTELFCYLPLAAVIGKKVLVVHGGLFSQDGVKLDDIRKIDRFRQPPESGIMAELMWSDPSPIPGRTPSKRGVGLSFGPDITKKFLADNNLDLLVRSHEVKEDGYEENHDGKCITIFSAPNYCDQMGNRGAFIRFEADMKPKFTSFKEVPHPPSRAMQYASPLMRMGM